jgi:hypothetical protein
MANHSPKCIYCGKTDNPFNRDHVIPQAFGTFEPESLILYNTVCEPCNNHFGRTLEQALSRDSIEAMLRLRHGIKPACEAAGLPYRRVELKVGQPGPWLGVTVVLETDNTGNGIEPVPVPQVAFRWKGGADWNFFLEKQMEDAVLMSPYRGAKEGTLEIRVIVSSDADNFRLVEKLKTLDLRFVQQGVLNEPITADGTVRVEIASQLDATIFRGIAKIAFNYVAHQHGTEFVLRADFDDTRNYIRYGTEPSWGVVVKPFRKPILFDENPRFRQTNGHLITFDWNAAKTGLVAQVSLFNAITYHVAICPYYSGIWHEGIRKGHHFDIERRSIAPLGSASSVVPV